MELTVSSFRRSLFGTECRLPHSTVSRSEKKEDPVLTVQQFPYLSILLKEEQEFPRSTVLHLDGNTSQPRGRYGRVPRHPSHKQRYSQRQSAYQHGISIEEHYRNTE